MTAYHAITAACLVAALVLYAAGFAAEAGGIVVFGLCFECLFWMRLLRKDKTRRQ